MPETTETDFSATGYPPSFAKLVDYYARQGGGAAPRLSDIELMDIYDLVPDMVLIDLEGALEGAHRFRWRLAGGNLGHVIGLEMTGRYLDEIAAPATAAEADETYCRVLKTGEWHAWRHRVDVQAADRQHLEYVRLLMPLLDETGAPRHLIGIYDFDAIRAG